MPVTPITSAKRPVDTRVVAVALVVASLLGGLLYLDWGWRRSALLVTGIAAGVVLYHAAFSFTGAWREFIVLRRGAGLRAQMVMLGLAVLVFMPVLGAGSLGGMPVSGSVAPLSLSILAGAFMFGVGMQLGGGCASGTLYSAGGGSVRVLITLMAFIAGSVLGTWHWGAWRTVPKLAPVSLLQEFGPLGAIALSLCLFTLVYGGTLYLERRRHGDVLQDSPRYGGAGTWWRGPWPLLAGAVGLALVNITILTLSGSPWGVTGAFAVWGAKVASFIGIDVTSWAYWQRPGAAKALDGSILESVASVTNIGIVLGALAAAGLAGRFAPQWRVTGGQLLAAIVGGLLLGYGARIAYGCNIGAFFAGVASSSLHGWVWFVAGLAGNAVGSVLRPRFGLSTR